jgi:hypothetical protein
MNSNNQDSATEGRRLTRAISSNNQATHQLTPTTTIGRRGTRGGRPIGEEGVGQQASLGTSELGEEKVGQQASLGTSELGEEGVGQQASLGGILLTLTSEFEDRQEEKEQASSLSLAIQQPSVHQTDSHEEGISRIGTERSTDNPANVLLSGEDSHTHPTLVTSLPLLSSNLRQTAPDTEHRNALSKLADSFPSPTSPHLGNSELGEGRHLGNFELGEDQAGQGRSIVLGKGALPPHLGKERPGVRLKASTTDNRKEVI